MKKLLIPLIAAFAANTVSAAAPQQVIDISTDKVSMVLTAAPGGEVYFRHFGGRIDDPAPLADYKSNRRSDHGTEDLAYPATGGRNFREPALRVTHADGDMNTELRYVSHASKQLSDKNVTETVVKMTDCCQALDVELVFTAYARENVITTHAVIRNREKGPVTLHSFYSSSLPLKADKYLLTHLYGAWAREAQVDHTLLTHGSKSIESTREVRTTHTENPAFLLTLNSDSFSETCGEVIAGALAWSGNFRLNFEVDEFDVLTVLAGANPNASEYRLRPGETFTTPEMIYTHSFCGAGGASRNLHDWARNYGIYHGHEVVPTLLNSWEGAYFKFDAKVLKQMIDDAASMGLEMFVLDDGWFGKRNSDTSSLGDYTVNEKKLPGGLRGLGEKLNAMGLQFGLWFEPESVSPDSELYRQHPDWALHDILGREDLLGRHQLLLDLTKPEVRDYLVESVGGILDSAPICYVKWDMNRHSCALGAQQHAFVLGLYDVLRRIFLPRPQILLESCSSGGNRFDCGMLWFSPQIWCSDDTDPVERLRIQQSLSFLYPPSCFGTHVSASPHAQTLRHTPLSTRGNVSLFGCLGYELDLTELLPVEQAEIRAQTEFYRAHRRTLQYGRFARGRTDGGGTVWQMQTKQETVAAVFHGLQPAAPGYEHLCVTGLDGEKQYRLTSRPQLLRVGDFGTLLRHVLPVKLNPNGLAVQTADSLYRMSDGSQSLTASGAAFAAGICLAPRFAGTGYDPDGRMQGDFGSNVYFIQEVCSHEKP